jgi:hypothetical protein
MYRLIINGQEMRQATSIETLENLLDRLPRVLAIIQELVPGLGWRTIQ